MNHSQEEAQISETSTSTVHCQYRLILYELTDLLKRSCLFFTFYFPPAQYFESNQALDRRKEL